MMDGTKKQVDNLHAVLAELAGACRWVGRPVGVDGSEYTAVALAHAVEDRLSLLRALCGNIKTLEGC